MLVILKQVEREGKAKNPEAALNCVRLKEEASFIVFPNSFVF